MSADATLPAVGYVRVSTTEQAVNGAGLDVQREALAKWARKQGYELARVLSDEGVSGSNGLESRDGLALALAEVEGKRAGVLVVYRLDRLARDLVLQETLLERVESAGGRVVSVTEPDIDSGDPTRVLVRQVLGALAQYERALIRARMAAGKARKAAAGGYVGGATPFGWCADGRGGLEPVPAERAAVELMVRLRGEGWSLRAIGGELDRLRFSPRSAASWSAGAVRKVLLREAPELAGKVATVWAGRRSKPEGDTCVGDVPQVLGDIEDGERVGDATAEIEVLGDDLADPGEELVSFDVGSDEPDGGEVVLVDPSAAVAEWVAAASAPGEGEPVVEVGFDDADDWGW